jgi:uncharacterized membrane protein YhhN
MEVHVLALLLTVVVLIVLLLKLLLLLLLELKLPLALMVLLSALFRWEATTRSLFSSSNFLTFSWHAASDASALAFSALEEVTMEECTCTCHDRR